jgi:hypothetical protein
MLQGPALRCQFFVTKRKEDYLKAELAFIFISMSLEIHFPNLVSIHWKVKPMYFYPATENTLQIGAKY